MAQQFYLHIYPEDESRAMSNYLHIHDNSSIIHNSKRQKQPKSPSTDKWINKLWDIHMTDVIQP